MKTFFALLAVSCALHAAAQEQAIRRAPAPGDRIAKFQLQSENGTPYDFSPGRVSLITFCAYWCSTWKQQLARVSKTRNDLQGLPVDFLAVSVDGRWTELGDKSSLATQLTRLKDEGGSWSSATGIDRVPFTMMLDKDGIIRWIGHGVCRSEEMASALRSAIQPRQSGGVIYLTFDDFPKAGSDDLLDVLRREEVPATFFCVCDRAQRNATILRRAIREGHLLEVHCWVHEDKTVPLPKCIQALQGAAQTTPEFLRAPGSESIQTADGRKLSAPVIDPYDYQRPGVRELLRRILPRLQNGCVIQLHAGVSETLDALPDLITSARQRGFIFEPLSLKG